MSGLFGSQASSSHWEPGEVGAVPVADVLARQVPLDWPEAVAVVAELCALLVAENRKAAQIPDAADVFIVPDGRLTINRRAAEHDLSYAARMLHALLAAANTPAPLRLFVSDAIASHKYESVEAFGEALAYYERPGRNGLIQIVLQRFLAAPTDGVGTPILLLPEEPKIAPVQHKRRRLSTPALAAAIVAVLAIFGAATFTTLKLRDGDAFSSTTTTAVTQAAEVIQRVGDRIKVGLGLTVPLSTAAANPEPAAPAPVIRPRRRVAVAPEPAQDAVADSGLAADTTAAPVTAPVAAPVIPLPIPAAPPPVDTTVYSAEATDVTPPMMMFSKIPNSAPAAPSAQMTLELLIGADGDVRQVRMLRGSTRMSDLMLLSAAKAWKFEPARRNGQPVSYRMVFDWTVAPR